LNIPLCRSHHDIVSLSVPQVNCPIVSTSDTKGDPSDDQYILYSFIWVSTRGLCFHILLDNIEKTFVRDHLKMLTSDME